MNKVMMKCGHTSNAVLVRPDGTEAPACVVCIGNNPDAEIVDTATPDLTGRMARCDECGKNVVASAVKLPWFRHRPDRPTDQYYCGCHGFD